MSFVDLAVVQQRVTVGIPLPFDVYSADETLLLAKGHVIETGPQLDQLLQRGARVGLADAVPTAASVKSTRPEQLPALLRSTIALACEALGKAPTEGYEAVVDSVAEPLMAIVEADPDLAIFQIIRQEGNYLTQYGVTHSIHCAFTAFLVATRFGWSEGDIRRSFNSALTMNVSMLELQGQLATQTNQMTAAQQELIESHPRRSALMLETVGIR
jgi:HD-GYP domain-containing protein (c-di-GMP phosphodiesterase class II)